ncbi:Abi-alpha family protein [Jatrophihabitans fulvus]
MAATEPDVPPAVEPRRPAPNAMKPRTTLPARRDPTADLVNTAGAAIVTVARVGRLLGRSGWRMARQVPAVAQLERQGRKLGHAAAGELQRLLEPEQAPPSLEEQRAARLAAQGASDPAPLRTAMTELLARSHEASGAQSREYLFGTIVSQLVPDEARILAALGDGRTFPLVDVEARSRSGVRRVLADVSPIGAAAQVSLPDDTATYLSRLEGYGLLQYGREDDRFGGDYRRIEHSEQVRSALSAIERQPRVNGRVVRRTVGLSSLGREFWAACAPRR